VQEAKSFHNFVTNVDPNLGVHVSYSFNRPDPDLDLFILFTQAICTIDFDLYLQHPPRLASSPDGDAARLGIPGRTVVQRPGALPHSLHAGGSSPAGTARLTPLCDMLT
jgi:hypothetical protein